MRPTPRQLPSQQRPTQLARAPVDHRLSVGQNLDADARSARSSRTVRPKHPFAVRRQSAATKGRLGTSSATVRHPSREVSHDRTHARSVNHCAARSSAPACATSTSPRSLGVDPKTVQRWLGGRVPHARHRWGVADLLSVHEYDLWPHLAELPSIDPEVYATYPHRGSVPREIWHRLFDHAAREIGILVYSGLFIAEDAELIRLLAGKGSRRGQPCGSPLATPTAPTSTSAATTRASTTRWPPRFVMPSLLYRPLLDCGRGDPTALDGALQLPLPGRRRDA